MEDGSPSEVTDSREAFGVSSGEMPDLRLALAFLIQRSVEHISKSAHSFRSRFTNL